MVEKQSVMRGRGRVCVDNDLVLLVVAFDLKE
jgi:hypothetical protein